MVAVNQCVGIAVGIRPPGVWSTALGMAPWVTRGWAGIPLRSVLEKAGIKSEPDWLR